MFDVIALPVAYALADRFAGGGAPKLDAKLPGRAAFWGALLAAVVGLLTIGPAGAALGLVWLIYRTPQWKLFPGASATPRGRKEFVATVLRHAICVPLAVAVAIIFDRPAGLLGGALAAYAVASTVLAARYAKAIDSDPNADAQKINATLELTRGALFGFCVALGL